MHRGPQSPHPRVPTLPLGAPPLPPPPPPVLATALGQMTATSRGGHPAILMQRVCPEGVGGGGAAHLTRALMGHRPRAPPPLPCPSTPRPLPSTLHARTATAHSPLVSPPPASSHIPRALAGPPAPGISAWKPGRCGVHPGWEKHPTLFPRPLPAQLPTSLIHPLLRSRPRAASALCTGCRRGPTARKGLHLNVVLWGRVSVLSGMGGACV